VIYRKAVIHGQSLFGYEVAFADVASDIVAQVFGRY
jgi:hypothetical protein